MKHQRLIALTLGMVTAWPATGAVLRGRVVDGVRKGGIPAVTVGVYDTAENANRLRITVTDKEGRYRIEDLEPEGRKCLVRFHKTGYLPERAEELVESLAADHQVDRELYKGEEIADGSYYSSLARTIQARAAASPDGAQAELARLRDFGYSDRAVSITRGHLEAIEKGAELYRHAVEALRADRFDRASDLLEQALEQDDELVPAHLALAEVSVRRAGFERALVHALKASELAPEDDRIQLVLFDALWGLEQRERALGVLDRMVQAGRSPEQTAVRAFNAGVHEVQARDFLAARARFEQALALNEGLHLARLALGQIALAQGDLESALSHSTAYLAVEPKSAEGLALAYQANNGLGRADGAREALQKLVAVDPERVTQITYQEGMAHYSAGQRQQAIAAFRAALEADPDHAQTHYMLGLTYAQAGDAARAREQLMRFLEIAQADDPAAEEARALLERLE